MRDFAYWVVLALPAIDTVMQATLLALLLIRSPGSFGDLLRSHRLRLGLTQEGIAERAGLSVNAIQKLERGGTHPYRAHLRDPSFHHMQAVSVLCEGGLLADVIPAIASIDPVIGGVDR